MSYSRAELEELLQNDAFVQWVLKADTASDSYWENWMMQNPEKKDLVLKTKEVVQLLHKAETEELNSTDKDQLVTETWNAITDNINNKTKLVRLRKHWYRYAVAASVTGLLGIGAILFLQKTNKPSVHQQPTGLVVNNINQSELQCINNTSSPQLVHLVDGSTITLAKNSSLKYARFLQPNKREVQLEGEAFFEVAKDANRPFYVYAGGIAVKVLGTSFRIVSDKKDGKVTVAVRTGKVLVFRKASDLQKEELVLMPQQQAVFSSKLDILLKATVSDSLLIQQPVASVQSFSFAGKPVNEIIEKLAKVYSTEIIYNAEKFRNCGGITVSLDAAALSEKLNILCKVLGATYRIENDKVFIDGNGCN